MDGFIRLQPQQALSALGQSLWATDKIQPWLVFHDFAWTLDTHPDKMLFS